MSLIMGQYKKELHNITLEEKSTGIRWVETHALDMQVSAWETPYQEIAEQIELGSDYIILNVEKTGVLLR